MARQLRHPAVRFGEAAGPHRIPRGEQQQNADGRDAKQIPHLPRPLNGARQPATRPAGPIRHRHRCASFGPSNLAGCASAGYPNRLPHRRPGRNPGTPSRCASVSLKGVCSRLRLGPPLSPAAPGSAARQIRLAAYWRGRGPKGPLPTAAAGRWPPMPRRS